MATPIKVPTIFTAVDKVTAVVRGMTGSVRRFTKNSGAYIQRFDQKVTSSFSKLGRLSRLGLGIGIAGIFTLAGQANLKYESSLASVSAITGAVGKDLSKLESISMSTAKATYKSGAEVLKAYELIGSAKPELLQNVDALDQVTRSAILLSKASKMDLEQSALSLTDVMNQFNIKGSDSIKVIDMLAAGAKYGAAAIPLIKDAILGFGATAKSANVSLQESVTLVELFATKGIKGAEAGTKLRNVLTNMSIIKALPPEALKQLDKFGVNTSLVADKTIPLIDRLKELSKIAGDPTAMVKMFGKENKDAAQILLQNLPIYESLIGKIGETGTAYEQAAKNSNTMAFWIEAIKNRFTDAVTATQSNNSALNAAKVVMRFVAKNMGAIVTVGVSLIGLFVLMKVVTWGIQAGMFLYNVALGINTALQKKNLMALRGNAIALKAYAAAQWVVNIATGANPIGLMVVAIVALIAAVAVVISYYDEWGASLLLILGPFGMIINLIQSFRRHWDSIKEAFASDGIVGGLKRIGAVILDSLLMPMKQFLGFISKIPGVGKFVAPAMKYIDDMRANLNLDTNDPVANKDGRNPTGKPEFIPSSQQQYNYKQETILQNSGGRGELNINVNDKNGLIKNMESKTDNYFPTLTSTQGQR